MNIAAFGIEPRGKKMVLPSAYRVEREGSVAIGTNAADMTPYANSSIHLSVCHSLAAAAGPWTTLERDAAGSLYQSFLWCRAWCETVGKAYGIEQRIVIGTGSSGVVQFILPLQIRRRQGVRVLEWLGSPHHGYGYGVFAQAFLATAPDWFATQWPRVVELAGAVDAIAFTAMPERLFGQAHPMIPLFNSLGPNPSFVLQLEPDFDSLYIRKRGGEDRRGARKRERALSKHGELSFGLPPSAKLDATLDIMFRQQEERLAELGVHGVFGPLERQFIHRLAELQDDDRPVLAPFQMTQNGETLAVMLGGLHANTYWALISSLAAGPMRKYSPGDLALRRTIRACCESGLAAFDFSAGDSAYKRAWADDVIQLHNVLGATNFRGLAWITATLCRLALKRLIKTSPPLLAAATALRRFVLGKGSLSR